jgi:hypothetical protein
VGLDKVQRHTHHHNQRNDLSTANVSRQCRKHAGGQKHDDERFTKVRQELQEQRALGCPLQQVQAVFLQ